MGPRGDCLLEFDWSVGEILNTLEELGLDKNTLVIISSDNGPVVDDGYKDQAVELLGDHKPGGEYRGGKYSIYEAGTRVPCIWRWPGQIKPGVSDALLCQIDWFATFAQMLNQSLPEGAAPDSRPMKAAWMGKEKKGRDYLVLQNAQNNLSITDGRWKYVRPGQGPAYNKTVNIELGNSMEPQLYDLKKDVGEKNNLAKEQPKRVQQLSTELEKVVDGRYGLPLY
jgi:arylsulfatase A-like enzyme